jgi:nitroreductase
MARGRKHFEALRKRIHGLSNAERSHMCWELGHFQAPLFIQEPGEVPTKPYLLVCIDTASRAIMLYDPHRRALVSENDFLGPISLGCAMENMWLMAVSLGIGVHIVSSQSEKGTEKEIKKLLDIPDNFIIGLTMRLGYPVGPINYLRVRRDLEDFTRHNGFKNKGLD